MALEAAFVLRDGVEHAGDAVGDVVLDDVAHIKGHEHHADGGEQDVEIVALGGVDVGGEHAADVVDEPLERHCRKAGENAHEEGEHEYEVLSLASSRSP